MHPPQIGYGDFFPSTVLGQMLFPVMILIILVSNWLHA